MLNKNLTFTFNHKDQPDKLYATMSSDEIKTAFDSRAEAIKTYLYSIIDVLNTNAASNIAYDPDTNLKTKIDSIVDGLNRITNEVSFARLGKLTLSELTNELDTSITTLETLLGSTSLATSNKTITGAVNELKGGIEGLFIKVGNEALTTLNKNISGAINELKSMQNMIVEELNNKALKTHTHTKSQITDFPTRLSEFQNDIGAGGSEQSHSHANISTLNNITDFKVEEWDNKPTRNEYTVLNNYSHELENMIQNNQDLISQNTSQLAEKAKQVDLEVYQNCEPLAINTFDGSYDALHPSVCYIENDDYQLFKYARFWMSYTPLPPTTTLYTDRYECPCIACSYDGIDWFTPKGLQNPIDDLIQSEIDNKDFFSDSCIIYNYNLKQLEVYYRLTNKNINLILFRKTSKDGINWSNRETVYNGLTSNIILSTNEVLSPQIIIKENGQYRMYFNNNGTGSSLRFIDTNNIVSNHFDGFTECIYINHPVDRNKPIHHGMFYEKETGVYHLLGYEGFNSKYGEVLYYTSQDGINFTYKGVAVKNANGNIGLRFSSLYQAVPIKVNNEWFIFATIADYHRLNTHRGTSTHFIALLTGDNLLNTAFVNGGMHYTREVYKNDIILANTLDSSPNKSLNPFRYVLLESPDREKSYGITIDRKTLEPIFTYENFDGKNQLKMQLIRLENYAPNEVPLFLGQVWLNKVNKTYYISTGTTSATDWFKVAIPNSSGNTPILNIENTGTVTNITKKLTQLKSDGSIDMSNNYTALINAFEDVNTKSLSVIKNCSEGREIIIINDSSYDITLTQSIDSTDGSLRLKDGVDRVLKRKCALKFYKYWNWFYEI